MKSVLCALLVLSLSGCFASKPKIEERVVYRDRPVTVYMPVPVERTPPAALRAAVQTSAAIQWLSPLDESVSVCLSSEGAQALREFTWNLLIRIEAWKAWAEPAKQPETL